jgi:hypothetical protein
MIDWLLVKQRDLKRRISIVAADLELSWIMIREGKLHEVWRCGSKLVTIPRHREINEYTAQGICKDLEGELGTGWWRR